MKKIFVLLFSFLFLMTLPVRALVDYFPITDADPNEGPWIFHEVNNGYHDLTERSIPFGYLHHTAWEKHGDSSNTGGVGRLWNSEYGIGFYMYCKSIARTHYGIFSTYYHSESVPAYTRKRMTWGFSLSGKANQYGQCVALYAGAKTTLVNMYVDYTGDFSEIPNSPYLIGHLVMSAPFNPSVIYESGLLNHTFDFDNRDGSSQSTISQWMMMTQVIENSTLDEASCDQWAGFRSESEMWETFYYNHVTFDANGGEGTMDVQEIENTQYLNANAFTRDGYTFAGWATSAEGELVYPNGASITATEENKGPVTLYAKWVPAPSAIVAQIDAIGAVEYTAESKEKIEQARAAFEMLDDEAKAYVVNYCVLIDAENKYAVLEAEALIAAIGTVTPASKDDIDAARAAYDALTLTEKTMVNNYSTLVGAEADFVELTKSSFVFMDKDAEPVGDAQRKALDYPVAPELQDKTFNHWQSQEKNITDKEIVIQAVYTPKD